MLVAKWGKGSGKDTVSRIILSRLAYLLICLKDPQKYLEIMPGDSINMLNVAFSAKQAQVIFFEPLKRMLEKSLWFRDKIRLTEDHIEFNKDINLYSGHSEQESMEGHNLLAAVLDEIAAFKTKAELELRQRRSVRALEHSAEALDNMVTSSATSRFPYLHKIIYISYTRFKGDYIEQKYDEGLKFPKTSFVSFGATWDVNPTKKREHFDREYEKNPENARAKFECDPPLATDAYFKHLTPELIAKVFPKLEPDLNPIGGTQYKPMLKPWFRGIPGVNYYIHIDLGISNDRAGFALTHRAGTRTVEVRRQLDSGVILFEPVRLPLVVADLWFSWLAPPGGEVSLEGIREFLFELHLNRYCHLAKVTYDKFQSADSIQILVNRGIIAELLSVDRNTEAYDTLKEVTYGERLQAYYSEVGINELQRLNIVTGNKVDHPLTGSKDEADALAGAVFNAATAEEIDSVLKDFNSGYPTSQILDERAYWKRTGDKAIPGIWNENHEPGRTRY
jgi:hypothetical protein